MESEVGAYIGSSDGISDSNVGGKVQDSSMKKAME